MLARQPGQVVAASSLGSALREDALSGSAVTREHETISLPSCSRSFASSSDDAPPEGNERVRKLAEEIMGLTVLEASWLTDILRKKLGMAKPAFGAMPMGMMAAAPAAAAAGAAPAAAPAEEKKEKTEFDVKLESFSAEGKIKVITKNKISEEKIASFTNSFLRCE